MKSNANPDNWVDEHADALYAYALARLRDPGKAEELVQETFVAALSNLESYGNRSSERTWLFGILKHKLIDLYRREQRESNAPQSESANLDDLFDKHGSNVEATAAWRQSPAQALETEDFWRCFESCMDRLPERQRLVFELRELDDAGTTEVCNILSISPSNLWVLLHRARLALRKCLEKNWFNRAGEVK